VAEIYISKNQYLSSNCFGYRGALNEQRRLCSWVSTVTTLRAERPGHNTPAEAMRGFSFFRQLNLKGNTVSAQFENWPLLIVEFSYSGKRCGYVDFYKLIIQIRPSISKVA